MRSRTLHEINLYRSIAAFLCAMVLAAALPARATVVPYEIEEMVALAEEIVVVEVVQNTVTMPGKLVLTENTVVVLDTIKGQMSGKDVLVTPGGVYKGIGMQVAGSASLKEGEKAVLFLSNPLKRLPKERQEKIDWNNKYLASPKIIGGWQGKLVLEPGAEEEMAKGVKINGVNSANKVIRFGGNGEKAMKHAPSYADFRAQLAALVEEQKRLEQSKSNLRKIGGARGEFAVPEMDKSRTAIRAFDPLPDIAYLSEEDLKLLQQEVHRQAEQAQKNSSNPQSAGSDQ